VRTLYYSRSLSPSEDSDYIAILQQSDNKCHLSRGPGRRHWGRQYYYHYPSEGENPWGKTLTNNKLEIN
jgi:hypothetical protein